MSKIVTSIEFFEAIKNAGDQILKVPTKRLGINRWEYKDESFFAQSIQKYSSDYPTTYYLTEDIR